MMTEILLFSPLFSQEMLDKYSLISSTLQKSTYSREDSTHGYHQIVNTEIRLITFFADKDGQALHNQQKQDQELIVAQIMNSLLQNSD